MRRVFLYHVNYQNFSILIFRLRLYLSPCLNLNKAAMNAFSNKPLLMMLSSFFLIVSCSIKEEPELRSVDSSAPLNLTLRNVNARKPDAHALLFGENLQQMLIAEVAPSECSPTKFDEVQFHYFLELIEDPIAEDYFNQYLYLNHFAALNGIAGNYFGEDGEYTHLVMKIKKDLQRFWGIKNIEVYGQHVATLDDRELLVDILWYVIADVESKEDLYPIVDEMLNHNAHSENLPENPFFAGEAFSTFDGRIILGDGLLDIFIESGVDPEIAWSGILSHEWAHQVQKNYLKSWYPEGYFASPSEETRQLELEADFFTDYYLTHKRGATYNWKKVDKFLTLFFESGDCAFDFPNHHGTPLQRMAAARAGNEMAESQQKKGFILTAEALHQNFVKTVFPNII